MTELHIIILTTILLTLGLPHLPIHSKPPSRHRFHLFCVPSFPHASRHANIGARALSSHHQLASTLSQPPFCPSRLWQVRKLSAPVRPELISTLSHEHPLPFWHLH